MSVCLAMVCRLFACLLSLHAVAVLCGDLHWASVHLAIIQTTPRTQKMHGIGYAQAQALL